ncbi:lipase/acyltransferase domain-containing protein [Chloroflexus sp.]|uniref:RCC1 domain-containing protein n=1 Tax=Chloroflexus sp. TaxID=1904827 RepID=UPI00298F1AB3|nr:carboxypeptidase regulatory-like domain-containing protein [Chloroflexus sp.]MDW8403002.1 carboxypeptidase regulatory-like domain-containing protein [Chloroflexus sp.]
MRHSAAGAVVLLIVLLSASFAPPSALLASVPPAAAESNEPPAPQDDATLQAIGFEQIAAGGEHTCGLTNTGLVYCWGLNWFGQLGDGTGTDRLTPVAVSGLSGAVTITAGEYHTCAVLGDGTVRCWGDNGAGQLGDGTTIDRLRPVAVSGLSGAVAIAAGNAHTCAALNDGAVRCWGYNGDGQLGDGTTIDRLRPVAVSGLSGVIYIAAGWSHTCAVLSNRTARCWGANEAGQLGDGTTTGRLAPVVVSGLSGAVAISAGSLHTCARLNDGTTRCWGSNWRSQLGDGTDEDHLTPVVVTGLNGAVALSAGGKHTCALLGDGTAYCWGYNRYGQLGDGTTVRSSIIVAVIGLSDAVAITAGNDHTCALLGDGTARCWGRNSFGQLGNSASDRRLTPVAVSGLSDVINLATGGRHTCARLGNGTVRCWGNNNYGQLGDGTSEDRFTPVVVSGLSGAVTPAAGDDHTCTLLQNGTARCWGNNWFGQLGDGTSEDRFTPVVVSGLSGAVALAASGGHTCALLQNGTARCWGWNQYGQLGDGTTTDRLTPVAVRGLSGAVAIAAGWHHTCALLNDGAVRCWGANEDGQLGDGTTEGRLTPVAVRGLSGAVALAAGADHTCTALNDGTVRCWGYNEYGQLGDGTATNRLTPVVVDRLSSAVALAAGDIHTCARLRDSTVRCWGANGAGQLGDGTTTNRLTPVVVSGLSGAVALAAGWSHTCAALNDGTVRCWGANRRGQLGDGTAGYSTVPVTVVGSGGITYAIAGRVVTASGLPMRGVQITTTTGATTRTDSNGAYRLTVSPAGMYSLSASTPGYTFNGPLTVTVGSGAEATANFTGTPKSDSITPLIFIPGIMGSKLEVNDDGTWRELWPASNLDREKRNKYMTQLNSDHIIATDAVRRVLTQDVYRPLIEKFLIQQQGYQEDRSDPQQRTPLQRCSDLRENNRTDVTLFIFAYDWRQPIERNAEELGRLITCVRTLHDAPQVNLLAHSMGGLVAGVYAKNLGDSVYVDKLITIATPWHGAPKMLMALFTGKEPLNWLARWVVGVSTDDIKQWSRVFPGAHQLLPSHIYVDNYGNIVFEEQGWDVNSKNGDRERYDYTKLISMLDSQYSPVGTNAKNFSSTYSSSWRPAQSEVEYYAIYGNMEQNTTVGKVIAKSIAICLPRLSIRLSIQCHNIYNFYAQEFTLGDGTVPISSARELRWTRTYQIGSDSSQSTEHSNLPNNKDVWEKIGQALDGQLAAMPSLAVSQTAPLPAVYITGIGLPMISVTDSLGNLVGSDGTLAVTDTVTANYYPLGVDAHALVFPASDTYTVTLRTGNAPFHLELTRGTGDSAELLMRYVDLNLPANISATLRITPQSVEPLRADTDGDGTFETEVPPTVSVTGVTANDLDAPTVTISATGPINAKTVTIAATDDGAGVKQLLYSLDGTIFQPYTAPFVVDAMQTPVVYAFADDNVANRSSLLAQWLVWQTHVPLTMR